MSNVVGETQGLRRTLRLRDLILYGIILIQPTAPMPVFGVLYDKSHGFVTATILLAMVAMLLTAISYGRMAGAYPHGGSAFLYVGKEIHPGLGYLTGWCLVMDYILNPLIYTIWCSSAAMNFVPHVPYAAWAVFFSMLFTVLNCNGIETSARINVVMSVVLGLVIVWILVATVRWLRLLTPPTAATFLDPLYNPATFRTGAVLRGTATAVLTYIGFDGISTLTDEARHPERNVPRAILITCLVTGLLASLEVYSAQLVWPRGKVFPDINTAYVYVSGLLGGPALFIVVNAALLLASIGSGMASQLGAARLLYAMGMEGALPRRIFAELDQKNRIPQKNVLLIGVLCLIGAMFFSFSLGADLLNFGALVAFIGVNISCALRAYRQVRRNWLIIATSLAGSATCALLWWNLDPKAKLVGSLWASLGVVLWIVRRPRSLTTH